MTVRRFSPSTLAAVRANAPRTRDHFDRLIPGDEFRVAGKRGLFRFVNATLGSSGHVDHVTAVGPLGDRQMFRAFAPDAVRVPSQRALNTQRRRRAAEGT